MMLHPPAMLICPSLSLSNPTGRLCLHFTPQKYTFSPPNQDTLLMSSPSRQTDLTGFVTLFAYLLRAYPSDVGFVLDKNAVLFMILISR